MTVDIIPPHLRRAAEAYGGLAALDIETLLGQLAETTEDDVLTWLRACELCALALHTAGEGSTGVLAEVTGKSGQTIRRWQKVGTVFSEADWQPAVQRGVYELAAKTDAPHEVLTLAADNAWKRRQLAAYLEDRPLTTRRELYHERFDLPPDVPGRALAATAHQLANPLMHALARAREEGDITALTLTVTLQATVGVGECEKRGEALADVQVPMQQIVEV